MTPSPSISTLARLAKEATARPWKWSASEGEVQLEGSVEYPEMNPVLITRGCGNKHKTALGVEGCIPEKLDDPLRACPLHASAADRAFIVSCANSHDALLRIAEAALAVDQCYRHMDEADSDAKLASALDAQTEVIGEIEESGILTASAQGGRE